METHHNSQRARERWSKLRVAILGKDISKNQSWNTVTDNRSNASASKLQFPGFSSSLALRQPLSEETRKGQGFVNSEMDDGNVLKRIQQELEVIRISKPRYNGGDEGCASYGSKFLNEVLYFYFVYLGVGMLHIRMVFSLFWFLFSYMIRMIYLT